MNVWHTAFEENLKEESIMPFLLGSELYVWQIRKTFFSHTLQIPAQNFYR